MASLSNSKKDDKSGNKEVANVADEPSGHSTVDIPPEITDFKRPGTLHRVPPQVRKNKDLYAPVVLPLGPYHHNKKRFDQAEQLKIEVLDDKLDENGKASAHSEFLMRAQEIRNFYGGVRGYNDNALAGMMLRDACFVVCYMASLANEGDHQFDDHIARRLGLSGYIFMWRDFSLLENQVPLWAIKLLIRLTLFKGDADDTRVEEFIWNFVSKISPDYPFVVRGERPWRNGQERKPLHLLELYRTARVKPPRGNGTNGSRKEVFRKIVINLKRKSKRSDHPARSVMDQKAKGIHVRPSSKCLTDIRFESNWFYGELLLPTLFINNNRKVLFSNLIAFEMSPETETEGEIISYVNFMQSLIESPMDVKQLRKKGVLQSDMNDEQVMNTFKELDIYGIDNDMFHDVKKKIDGHCGSKAKTWMVQLGYTYFRNPWSVIALFSAAILLCLTILQTIYTMK